MTFVGSLIKKGVALNQKIQFEAGNPIDEQEKELRKLLKTAKGTSFGKFYDFEGLLEQEDLQEAYRERVPIRSYEEMHESWWRQQQEYPDITWPGKPAFFALSSGTTGKSSKRIPITDEFLTSMREVGQSLISELPNYDFPEQLFESEILMLSSSANLSKHEYGHLEGEISGINVSNFPGWYDLFYRPGKEIAGISNWDERVAKIVEEAPNWNIGAIAGIPSWVLLMLQEIVKDHNLNTIHDIWPNLTVYASGGVAFETYRSDFEAICEKPLVIMDTYLASEGFFAYSANPESLAMRLATSHGYYYEFVPFDDRGVDETGQLLEDPEVLQLDQVTTDEEYVLVVTSCAGAWRYVIGDTIKFTSLNPYEILITGRTKFFLNTVGSQLSEEKLDDAILEASKQIGVQINEYSVAAVKNEVGDYIHQWVVVTDGEIDREKLIALLDKQLSDANKNYKVARDKALKGLDVEIISKDQYYAYLEKGKKKGGQIKTPKVMKEEKMTDFLGYIRSLGNK